MNYKSRSETKQLVQSLQPLLQNIFIVDNSSDRKLEDWSRKNLEVEYFDTEQNLGYTGGNNAGIKQTIQTSEYIFILNPDVEIPTNFSLPGLISVLESRKEMKILSPLVLSPDGEQLYDPHPPTLRLFSALGFLPTVKTQQSDEIQEAHIAPGSCLLIDTDLFETIGTFDEDFFLYRDEVEFCIRALQHGYKIAIHSGQSVIHDDNNDLRHNQPHQMYYDIRNRFLLVKRAFSRRETIIAYPIILVTILSQLIKILNNKNPKLVVPLIEGIFDGVLGQYGQRRY